MWRLIRFYLLAMALLLLVAMYFIPPATVPVLLFEQHVNPPNIATTIEHDSSSAGRTSTPAPEPTNSGKLRPGQCISSFDCPHGQSCSSAYDVFGNVGHCTFLVPLGGRCSESRICEHGLACRGSPKVCTTRANEGEPCGRSNRFCADGLVCTPSSRCSKPLAIGEGCTTRGQCEDSAFCQFRGSGRPKCEPLRAIGEPCNEDFSCLGGFCDGYGRSGVCRASRGAGAFCGSEEECQKGLRCIGIRRRETGFSGKCIAAKDVVTGRGLPCDLELSNCDDTKRLVCKLREGGPICVEELEPFSSCDPTSKVQICRPDRSGFEWRPTVCREILTPNTKEPTGEFGCLTPFVDLRKGEICNAAPQSRCRGNLVCDTVPGVGHRDSGSTRYCREPIGVGEDCSDPFQTVCVPDGKCRDGVCVATGPVPSPTPLGGLGEDCSSLKCARGLSCGIRFGKMGCILKPVVVRGGEVCGSNATNTIDCALGFICISPRFRPDDDFRPRCTKPSRMGENCTGRDEECLGPLICEDVNEATGIGKCYDEDTGLKLGDACDPHAKTLDQMCGFQKRMPLRRLVCAPEGSSFVCKRQLVLGSFCVGVDNAICAEPFSCSKRGDCV